MVAKPSVPGHLKAQKAFIRQGSIIAWAITKDFPKTVKIVRLLWAL